MRQVFHLKRLARLRHRTCGGLTGPHRHEKQHQPQSADDRKRRESKLSGWVGLLLERLAEVLFRHVLLHLLSSEEAADRHHRNGKCHNRWRYIQQLIDKELALIATQKEPGDSRIDESEQN